MNFSKSAIFLSDEWQIPVGDLKHSYLGIVKIHSHSPSPQEPKTTDPLCLRAFDFFMIIGFLVIIVVAVAAVAVGYVYEKAPGRRRKPSQQLVWPIYLNPSLSAYHLLDRYHSVSLESIRPPPV